jgi:hypothetical protein
MSFNCNKTEFTMRIHLLGLLSLLTVSPAALADYMPTTAEWPGVKIMTSEDLFWGSKYKGYPIGNLFDGDPKTAWVFKGVPPPPGEGSATSSWGGKYAISIEFDKPRYLDGIQIMNGYNKSAQVFARNNRILRMRILDGAKPHWESRLVQRAVFKDRMGWHTASMPSRRYNGITLVFDRFIPGRDRDLAISELRFTYRGKVVPIRTPRAYMYTEGSSCGCGTEYASLDRGGRVIAREGGVSEGPTFAYSPSGRYVVGFEGKDARVTGWIVDVNAGRLVARRSLPEGYPVVKWSRERSLVIEMGPNKRVRWDF